MDNTKIKICCKCHVKPRLRNNSYCRDCERKRWKQRWVIDRNNILKTQYKWDKNHPDKIREYSRRYDKKMKEKVYQLLGNKCANLNCPIPTEKFDTRSLQLDHVNGGGTKERQNCKKHYWNYIYNKILDGAKDYQLLCAYCNWMKKINLSQNKSRL